MAMMGTATMQAQAESQPRILPAKWDGRTVFKPKDAAEILNRSIFSIYADIQNGEIAAVRIGRCLKIPRHVLERLLSI
jgi:hypothetical protein